MADSTEEQEHGVAFACYQGGPGEPYFQATMECLCGWKSGRCEGWEESGRLMDEHLEEVK